MMYCMQSLSQREFASSKKESEKKLSKTFIDDNSEQCVNIDTKGNIIPEGTYLRSASGPVVQ